MRAASAVAVMILAGCCTAAKCGVNENNYHITFIAGESPLRVRAVVRDTQRGEKHEFDTVEALEAYLTGLPRTSDVHWHYTVDTPPGYEKFARAWPQIRKACAEHGVSFHYSYPDW